MSGLDQESINSYFERKSTARATAPAAAAPAPSAPTGAHQREDGGRLDQRTIDAAKAVDIADLVRSRGVELTGSGNEFKGLCPFHDEKSPSFTVNTAKAFYHCFGCGAHGDAIDFVREFDGVTFHEAVHALVGAQPVMSTPHKTQAARAEPAEEWRPITPVPEDADQAVPTVFHRRNGDGWQRLESKRRWAYRDAAGRLLGYVHRFEWKKPDGTIAKDCIPQSYCVNSTTGEMRWKWQSFAKPRPLYGLDKLAKYPDAAVIMAEGEKAADRGQERFIDAGLPMEKLIVLAWPGGGKGVKHVDWTPLHGRKVGLWPDADQKRYPEGHPRAGKLLPFLEQPGTVAMLDVFERIKEHCSVARFILPCSSGLIDGWDLADELPANFNLRKHVKTHGMNATGVQKRFSLTPSIAAADRVLPVWLVPPTTPADLRRASFAADVLAMANSTLTQRLDPRGVVLRAYDGGIDGLRDALADVGRLMPSARVHAIIPAGIAAASAKMTGFTTDLLPPGASWVDELWERAGLQELEMADPGDADLMVPDLLEDAAAEHPVDADTQEQVRPISDEGDDALESQVSTWDASRADASKKGRRAASRDAVAEINKQHALALMGDKVVVLRETIGERGGKELLFMSIGAFKAWHLNQFVPVESTNGEGAKTTKYAPVADVWLKSGHRRQYEGVTFAPGNNAPATHYNLWSGYAVEPLDCSLFRAAMACRRLLAHMKYILCGGNREHFRYLLAWAADMLQDPDRKKGVALVMRGLKGTGKSTFADALKALLGRHAIKVAHMRHLTGNFNRHLADKLLVVAEESFWAGDKADEGPLKDMITSPTLTVEAKGVDAVEMRSLCRVMMITNNDWAVPASTDERRYFVLDVSDRRRQDFGYFAAIEEQLANDGLRALLTLLLRLPLDTVNLRKVPETRALRKQRALSLEPHDQFAYDAIVDGALLGKEWHEAATVGKDALYDAYIESSRKRGKVHLLTKATFGKKFMAATGAIQTRLRAGVERLQAYKLLSRRDAAAIFSRQLGVDLELADPPNERPF